MKLRTRLLVAFGVAIVVPVAAVGTLTARSVTARFSREYERRLDEIRRGVEAELEGRESQIAAGLSIAAASDLVQRLLVSLNVAARGGANGADAGVELSRSVGLPLLKLLGEDGKILTSAHRPAAFGYPDPDGLAFAKSFGTSGPHGKARVVLERIGTERTASLERAQWIELGSVRLALVGGIPLDQAFLDGVRRRLGAARVELRASRSDESGGSGIHVFAEAPEGADLGRLRTVILPLPLAEGVDAALTVGVSTENLDSLIGDIREAFILITCAGLALALAAALFFARGVTLPIESLAEGVRGVSKGMRTGAIELRVGGELGELIAAFNAMIRDLKAAEERLAQSERVAAWQEIARRLAHEIKNSLFPIQLSIQTLRKVYVRGAEGFAEAFDESTKMILEEVGSLKGLVEEFSQFARLPKPLLESTALPDLLSGVIGLLVRPRPDVQLVESLEEGLPPVLCDREQMKRVFVNVIGNALEAMPAGGDLRVSARRTGDEGEGAGVDIEIQDSGAGISDEDRKKLFIPYFTTKANGTGLGLPIVQRIVTEHGGTVRIGSEPGRGTSVTIHLPLATPLAANPDAPGPAEKPTG